jgi:uncharacterized damage-inducible protein DinB
MEQTDMNQMKEDVKRELVEARYNLLAILEELRDPAWDAAVFSEEETWTVSDLLRHLTAAERDMTLLIERIRQGSDGVPPDFDLDRWNARSISKAETKSPAELQAEMHDNRAYLLSMIDTIEPREWDMQGRHGSLRIMSVEEILRLIADHERRHTADIHRATNAL